MKRFIILLFACLFLVQTSVNAQNVKYGISIPDAEAKGIPWANPAIMSSDWNTVFNCIRTGEYDRAIKALNNIIADKPLDSSEAYFYRSLAYEAINNVPAAIEDVTNVIKAEPSLNAYGWRAYLYARTNKHENIEKMYNDISSCVKFENSPYITNTMSYLRLIFDDYRVSSIMKDQLYSKLITLLQLAAKNTSIEKNLYETLILPIKFRYIRFVDNLENTEILFEHTTKKEYIAQLIRNEIIDSLENDTKYLPEMREAICYTGAGLMIGSNTEDGQNLLRKGKSYLPIIKEKYGEVKAREAETTLSKIISATNSELSKNYYTYGVDAKIWYEKGSPRITVYGTSSYNQPIHGEKLVEIDGHNVVGESVYNIYKMLFGRRGTKVTVGIKRGGSIILIDYLRVPTGIMPF